MVPVRRIQNLLWSVSRIHRALYKPPEDVLNPDCLKNVPLAITNQGKTWHKTTERGKFLVTVTEEAVLVCTPPLLVFFANYSLLITVWSSSFILVHLSLYDVFFAFTCTTKGESFTGSSFPDNLSEEKNHFFVCF